MKLLFHSIAMKYIALGNISNVKRALKETGLKVREGKLGGEALQRGNL